MPKFKDITGNTINNWYVIKYIGNQKWKCLCTICNTEHIVYEQSIISNKSIMCKNLILKIKKIR